MDKQANIPGTPKEVIRATKILVTALVTGVIFFAIIILFLSMKMEAPLKQEGRLIGRYFFLFSVLAAVVCLAAAFYFYKKRITVVKSSSLLLKDKLNHYRAALILFLAWCEGAALLSVIIFFLTGLYETLLITVVLVMAMLSKMPGTKKLADELNLNWNEQSELK